MNRRPIFQAVRTLRDGKGFTLAEVALLDKAIDEALSVEPAPPPSTQPAIQYNGRQLGERGAKLMHAFEGCKLNAYPDPGSADGNPWTIGWGSTGPGIHKGVTWTQEQADARFVQDISEKYGKAVNEMLGDTPTTQNQFDALVSLCYNIGIRALRNSTVMRKHKAGDHLGAARAFLMWNKNDGQVMRGLTRRRLAEADLYDDV